MIKDMVYSVKGSIRSVLVGVVIWSMLIGWWVGLLVDKFPQGWNWGVLWATLIWFAAITLMCFVAKRWMKGAFKAAYDLGQVDAYIYTDTEHRNIL